MKDTKRFKSPRKRSLATLLGACAGLSVAGSVSVPAPAAAESIPACTASECSADYMQLDVNEIQYGPGLFKLQARVSQAKIPVGDAVFDAITVNLVRPGSTTQRVACTETLPNVRVRNSVLNLDIGRQMSSCDMDQVVAQEADLAFEICINSPDNCLKPIPLGTTPYSIKSNYAVLSQKAHEANEAVQAHYAHRVTADTELFVGERNHEDGYVDFATPDGNDALGTTGWERFSAGLKTDMQSVYGANVEDDQAAPVGGFIQWTPVSGQENLGDGSQGSMGSLHIVAKDEATANKLLKPLARMVIHADDSYMTGNLHVIAAPGYEMRSTETGTRVEAGRTSAYVTDDGYVLTIADESITVTDLSVVLRSAHSALSLTDDEANLQADTATQVTGGLSGVSLSDVVAALAGPTATVAGTESTVATGGASTLSLAGVAELTSPSVSIEGASATLVDGGSSNLSLEASARLSSPNVTIDGANSTTVEGSSSRLRLGASSATLNSPYADLRGTSAANLRGGSAYAYMSTASSTVHNANSMTVRGGSGSVSLNNTSATLTGGGVTLSVREDGVHLGNACLKDVDLSCLEISGGSVTSLDASKVFGAFDENAITNIPASRVSGALNASNVTSVPASRVSGALNASNVTSVPASRVTGALNASLITSVPASRVSGELSKANIPTLSNGDISGLNASKIDGRLSNGNMPSNASLGGTRVDVTTRLRAGHTSAIRDSDVKLPGQKHHDGSGECSGGSIQSVIEGNRLCMDDNEIQSTHRLHINHDPSKTGDTYMGDVSVNNLTVRGSLSGALSQSGRYTADSRNKPSNSASTTLTDSARSMCFITGQAQYTSGARSYCFIQNPGFLSGGPYKLWSYYGTVCYAQCISW